MFSDNPSPGNIKINVDSVTGKTYLSSNIIIDERLIGTRVKQDSDLVHHPIQGIHDITHGHATKCIIFRSDYAGLTTPFYISMIHIYLLLWKWTF